MSDQELLVHIERIVWDPNTSDIEKIHSVQGILYEIQEQRTANSISVEEDQLELGFRRWHITKMEWKFNGIFR